MKSLHSAGGGVCLDPGKVNSHFAKHAPKFSKYIHDTLHRQYIWPQIFDKKMAWEDGPSELTALILDEEEIQDNPNLWEDVGCDASCERKYHEIHIAQRRISACRIRAGLRTPEICIDNFRDLAFANTLAMKYLETLRKNNNKLINDSLKNTHADFATHMVATPGMPQHEGAPAPGYFPTSILTHGILEEIASYKEQEDAATIGESDGAQLYWMIIGSELWNSLLHVDRDFREMLLYSNPRILNAGRNGGDMTIGNFRPRQVRRPDRARINPATGELELVQPRITLPGEQPGQFYSRDNPDWHDHSIARYEAVDFPDPMEFETYVRQNKSSVGPFNFGEQRYDGVPIWDLCPTNIEKNTGFFRLFHERAYLPVFPERGVRLWVERQPNDSFRKAVFFSSQTQPVKVRKIDVRPNSCCQGDTDQELRIGLAAALPDDWTTVNVRFRNGDIRKANVVGHFPTKNNPHRYAFEFECDTECGCCGGPQDILEIATQPPAPSDACDPCPDPCETCEALPAVAGAENEDFVSTLDITLAGLTANPGDSATVNFGKMLGDALGTVIAYDGTTLTVGFHRNLAPNSGEGVCSVTVGEPTPVEANCYRIDLDCDCATAWTDGHHELGGFVPAVVSYAVFAADLNASIGVELFEPTMDGVRYIGDGEPSPLTLRQEDGTDITVNPEPCIECNGAWISQTGHENS